MASRTVILVDASPSVGGGRVTRCLALAHELCRHGEQVSIVARQGTIATAPLLLLAGLPVSEVGDDPGSWAAEIGQHVAEPADWLVLDCSTVSPEFEKASRQLARKVMVIDDRTDRPHDCDLFLNPALGLTAADFKDLLPEGCRILTGPSFAPLRPEFALARADAMARRANVFAGGEPLRRILVSLGMTDSRGLTAPVMRAIAAAGIDTAIDVIVGPAAANLTEIVEIASQLPSITLHAGTERMHDLMLNSDLAIGVCGMTTWERCCLGLPSIVLADQGDATAQALQKAHAAFSIDPACGLGELTEIVRGLARDHGRFMRMTMAASGLVDGLGTRRVREAMARAASPPPVEFLVRPATKDDCRMAFGWRSDPVARSAWRHPGSYHFDDHVAWFDNCLSSDAASIFIAERHHQPVALVWLEPARGTAHDDRAFCQINIAVAPDRRGQGLGRRTIQAVSALLRARTRGLPIIAEIREGNHPAMRIFQHGGFLPVFDRGDDGFIRLALTGLDSGG